MYTLDGLMIVCLSQGEEGVRQVLELLRDELSLAMALSGTHIVIV